jgi:hypothetical protein
VHTAILPVGPILVCNKDWIEYQSSLQFLAERPCSFSWSTALYLDDLNEVWNTAHVILLVLFAGQPFDLNSDCGIWFLL